MFKSRSDRKVVTLLIEVNLVALDSWLRRGGDIEDINFAQESQQQETELSSRYLEYYIDILPRGEKSEMYFDRAKAAFLTILTDMRRLVLTNDTFWNGAFGVSTHQSR